MMERWPSPMRDNLSNFFAGALPAESCPALIEEGDIGDGSQNRPAAYIDHQSGTIVRMGYGDISQGQHFAN